MASRKKWSMAPRRLTPWILLTPVMLLMLGLFVFSLLRFFNYSFYGYLQEQIVYKYSPGNYIKFFTDTYFTGVLLNTLKLAAATTVFAFLIGYPLAYACARSKNMFIRRGIMIVVFLPLVVSVVVRSYGWYVIMSTKGLLNWVLQSCGLIHEPLHLMYNFYAVLVATVHVLLPFMVFPILSALLGISPELKEAAYDLGASRWKRFTRVTFPLSLTGVLGGIQTVFTLAMSGYVTPVLLGGGRVMVLSRTIYEDTVGMNWPMAATSGAVMLLVAFLIMLLFNKAGNLVRTS